jgi:nucleoside-diphosphate-sugar epimerase
MPVVTVRPPAVYGPEDTAILAMFQTVSWHAKPLFGPQPQNLSIVHVEDLVRGIMLAMENEAARGEVFFIAEDQHYTLAQLQDLIQQAIATWAFYLRIPKWLLMTIAGTSDIVGSVFGFTPRLNRDKARDFLIRNWTCSTEKANRVLGYRSMVPFADGAKMTAEWYRAKGWL